MLGDAMVEAMDKSIQSVLEHLRVSGFENNTLVVFTYDHGGRHFADSGPLFHGFSTLWEGGIRVPLIMRWPGMVPQHDAAHEPTIAMDITATLLNAANRQNATSNLDGASLLRPKEEFTALHNRPLFWKHKGMTAVRQGNWKYLVDANTQFLFDLSKDIGERTNQFARNTAVANQLREQLEDWKSGLR